MTDASYYRGLVQSVIEGKPWLVALNVLVPAALLAQGLKDFGATRVFALGASRGMGSLPDPEDVPQLALDNRGTDMMAAIRAGQDLLADLPAHARDALDRFDPEGAARAIGTLFSDGRPVAGRRMYGTRPAAWQALEDKVSIDAFWDAAGIARAPSRTVTPDLASLTDGAAELDRGAGTVWAGDDREGFNGAAWGVRWVRTSEQADEAAAFFAKRCDRVRVMPFLEGIPCSIHGIVLPDRVLALRPCEMVVFRRPGQATFHYAQAATFWDPPPADREAMRTLARRAGRQLREQVGYRGVFTVDGVMTAEGFLPTELNPRFGAALMVMARGLPELPIYLLHLAMAEGEDLEWRGEELERLLLHSGDAFRQGSGSAMLKKAVEHELERGLVCGADGWRFALDDEPADATFALGPGPMGGYAKVILDSARTPVGPSVAPRIGAALGFVDEALDLGIGPLEPARDVRR
jgi:hypothetical protein